MARESVIEAARRSLEAVNRPMVTDSTTWRDIPPSPAGLYEMVYSETDKKIILNLKRSLTLPEVGKKGNAYCFEWADGRGVCAFKRKKDALAWMEADQRDVSKFWYGEPVCDERKITVRTRYKTGD